jgi:polar amino acid transport system substrate-binding protein
MKLKVLVGVLAVSLGLIGTAARSAEQVYTVQSGDSLSSIAYRFYRDQAKWPAIEAANRDKVFQNGTLVLAGVALVIPELDAAAGAAPAAPAAAAGITRRDPATGAMQIDLVTGDDFKPYTDEGLPEGGMFTDIVRQAFRQIGYEPVFDFVNWSSGYSLTQRGKFAATFPYAVTEERKADFLYSDSVADTLTFAYYRKGKDFTFTGMSDLAGLKVCRPGGYFTDFLDAMIEAKQFEFHQPKELATCFRDLLADKVDVVIIGEFEANSMLVDLGAFDQVVHSDVAVTSAGLHVIFPKSVPGSPELLDRFNATLRAMASSGELNAIVERHMKAYYASLAQPQQ